MPDVHIQYPSPQQGTMPVTWSNWGPEDIKKAHIAVMITNLVLLGCILGLYVPSLYYAQWVDLRLVLEVSIPFTSIVYISVFLGVFFWRGPRFDLSVVNTTLSIANAAAAPLVAVTLSCMKNDTRPQRIWLYISQYLAVVFTIVSLLISYALASIGRVSRVGIMRVFQQAGQNQMRPNLSSDLLATRSK